MTRSPTSTRSPTLSPTITLTPTITATPTVTSTLAPGPDITFFGLATAFNEVLAPSTTEGDGTPVYLRSAGFGFIIVVEARPGSSGSLPGRTPGPVGGGGRPDLQIQADRDLGNGSPEVCDKAVPGSDPPEGGGVPGIDPPSYDPNSPMITDALNDLGCRFEHRTALFACTNSSFGNPRYVHPDSTDQYCTQGVVNFVFRFHPGDTTLTVRWRDGAGNLGPPAKLIVRVP